MSLLYRMGTGNGNGGDLKPYIVQFTCDSGYIGQTLTMTYKGTPHAGETVDNVSGTVASDGTLTLYPMHSGNWECSCYSSVTGTTMKKTIELSYWGTTNVEFNDIPDGATVTPIDDVQTWLHCANIWDKSYKIVSEVIADKTILNALVQNENANDYLVRSTAFANTLCENNVNNEAMYYLGLYSECANKLLADDTWLEAICNADVLLSDGATHLFEKVLNVKVPIMTSNTAPSGEAKAINYYDAGLDAFRAFDNNSNYFWAAGGETKSGWIQYKFVNPVNVKKVKLKNSQYTGSQVNTFKIECSDDGEYWKKSTNTITSTNKAVSGTSLYNINLEKALYWRLTVLTTVSANINVDELQFYGREET